MSLGQLNALTHVVCFHVLLHPVQDAVNIFTVKSEHATPIWVGAGNM